MLSFPERHKALRCRRAHLGTEVRRTAADILTLAHFLAERTYRSMVNLLRIAWTRIVTNMRDPRIRKNVIYFMGAKMLGFALLLTAMRLFLPSLALSAARAT